MLKKLLVSCLLAAVPMSTVHAETLLLKNNDKLSGEIIFKGQGRVDIQNKYGVFEVPLSDISGVITRLENGETRVNPVKQNVRVWQQTPQEGVVNNHAPVSPLPPADVAVAARDAADLTPAEEAENSTEADETGLWGAKWSGNVNLGGSVRTGNSDTQTFNADFETKAKWEKYRANLSAEYNREEDADEVTVDDRMVALGLDYFFAERWFWENKAKFEQDDIELLDLRTTLTTGIGYQVYERDDLNLSYVLGGGYQREEYDTGETNDNITANWSLDYDQKVWEERLKLFHEHSLSVPVDAVDAFLFQSETGLRMPLPKNLNATAQVDFDWDNDPAEGAVEDDTTYSLKLGYEW